MLPGRRFRRMPPRKIARTIPIDPPCVKIVAISRKYLILINKMAQINCLSNARRSDVALPTGNLAAIGTPLRSNRLANVAGFHQVDRHELADAALGHGDAEQ